MYIGIICQNSKLANELGNILAGTLGGDYPDKFAFIKRYLNILNGNGGEDQNTYRASFSHPLKSIVTMLTGVPFEILNDSTKKKEYVININTFEYKAGVPDLDIETLYNKRECGEEVVGWLTVNDFINYFGHHVCKRFIGNDVWVRCEEKTTEQYPTTERWRIYSDVRTKSEYDFIKRKGGVLIRINTNKKYAGCIFDKSLNDVDVDYQLTLDNTDGLYQVGTSDEVYEIINKLK